MPTAVLGGVVLVVSLLLVMNYNHPYSTLVREYFVTTPIVPGAASRVVAEGEAARGPTDGFITQLLLRPGMMAVPLPLRPVGVFVHAEDRAIIGAFWQNSLQRIRVGDEAEVIFRAVPSRVFKGKVSKVLPVLAQGQFQASGNLISVEMVPNAGKVPVMIELDDDLSAFHLPAGVIGSGAIYTEHAHHVAVMRKILLCMVSWQNYVFGELH